MKGKRGGGAGGGRGAAWSGTQSNSCCSNSVALCVHNMELHYCVSERERGNEKERAGRQLKSEMASQRVCAR